MDEKEFERLLQKGIQNNISSYNFDSLGAGPKTAQKIAYEREEAARKNKALELQKEKLEKEQEDDRGVIDYTSQWITNTALKTTAMVGDMAHLFDVGDYHNYMPESWKRGYNPLYMASKFIDNTIGDGEYEVGNWVSNNTGKLRDVANRYYSDYGKGAKNAKDPIFGWSAEDWLNGSSDLVGSIIGVLTPGGAIRAGATGLTKLGVSATAASRAAHVVSTGAMTMAVSGSIGSEVYDNVQEYWLDQDAEYKNNKEAIKKSAIQNFYENNPNAKEFEALGFAEEQVDKFREEYIADPNNAEKVKFAKGNAIKGADSALKTSFVFGLATNYLMGSIIAKGVGSKLTTASTRKFSEVLQKDGTKKVVQNKTFFEKPLVTSSIEGVTEAAEEGFFEQYAAKQGELVGKGMNYGFSDVLNEFSFDETMKSIVFGGLGGLGTAGAFNFFDSRSESAKKEIEAAKKQMEEFNTILETSGALNLKEAAYLESSAKEQVEMLKKAKNLAAEGKTEEAEQLYKQVAGLQALSAFETGTTDKLQETYTHIANDENNSEQVRKNATEILNEINQLEKSYLDIYNTNL